MALLGYYTSYISIHKNPIFTCPNMTIAISSIPYTDRVLIDLLSARGGRPLLNLSDVLNFQSYCSDVYCAMCSTSSHTARTCTAPNTTVNLTNAGVVSGPYTVRVRSLVAGWTAISAVFNIVGNTAVLTSTSLAFSPPFTGYSVGYLPYATTAPVR